ncbi:MULTISPECIES: MFS transporter [unclassified Modestobacter]
MTTTEPRSSLWQIPAVRSLFSLNLLGFLSYSLLLSALPAHAAAVGYGLTAAGSVTTVFLGVTVLGQLAVPALVNRLGVTPVLIGGLLAIGLPSPFYLLSDDLGWFAAVSAVRGLGFAVITVLGSTIAAQVVPPERRGESIGLYGLAIAVPMLGAVPGGTALTLAGHFGWVAALAAAPALACVFVPALGRAMAKVETPSTRPGSARRAVRASVAPSLVLLVVTFAAAGFFTFLPIERPDGALAPVALLCYGLTSGLARWRVGVLVDRLGARALLPGTLAVGVAGLLLIAWGLVAGGAAGAAAVLGGSLLLGVTYGAVQNLTLVVALARAGSGPPATVSAVWNACYDSGTATGALLVGAVAAGVGLPWTYVLIAALLAAALPLATVLGRTPVGAAPR